MVKVLIRLGMTVLHVILWIAGKLRLTLPVLYLLILGISTIFSDWVIRHKTLTLWGLYILLGFSALSWLCSLAQLLLRRKQARFEEEDMVWQLRRAREHGVPLDSVLFDSSNNLIDPRTGVCVNFGAGH